MAGLALACILLVAVQVAVADECEGNRHNANRIHFLEGRLDSLEADLAERKTLAAEKLKELAEVEHRIDKQESAKCGKREVMCDDDSKKCLDDLRVCDHHEDCPGGSDESEEQCKNRAHAGLILHGDIIGDHCAPDHIADHIHIHIIAHRALHWFNSVHEITASVTLYYSDGTEVNEKHEGKYFFGGRALVVYSGEGHNTVDVVCRWGKGDTDHCDCEFVHEDTLEVCGRTVMWDRGVTGPNLP